MNDYTKSATFNSDANFKSVKFGDKAPVLEVELDELQAIQGERLRSSLSVLIGDGIKSKSNITYTGGVFSISNTEVVINGELIHVSSLTLSVVSGDNIYLDLYDEEIDYSDIIKKYGNAQENNTVTNNIMDSRMSGFETSRRIGLKYDLSKTNVAVGHSYLQLGHIDLVSGLLVIDAKVISNNAELIEGIDLAESNAKEYADTQIQMVTATGIPKLVSYPFDLYATVSGQTVYQIPYDYFDMNTDTLMVFFDGIFRPKADFIITNTVTVNSVITRGYITLTSGRPLGSYIGLLLLKNVPIGTDGSINGGVLAVNSIPQNRVVDLTDNLASKANLLSPEFSGTPIAPTPVLGTNDTQVATTAFINNLLASVNSSVVFYNNALLFRGTQGMMADSDSWRVGGYGTTSDSGCLEIATGDNGTEPIYVRQYSSSFTTGTIARTLTLLDSSGNTGIPGNLRVEGALSISYNNVLEMGKYIDMHEVGSTNDYDYRLMLNGGRITGQVNGGTAYSLLESRDVVNSLTSTATNLPLSSAMGKSLQDQINYRFSQTYVNTITTSMDQYVYFDITSFGCTSVPPVAIANFGSDINGIAVLFYEYDQSTITSLKFRLRTNIAPVAGTCRFSVIAFR